MPAPKDRTEVNLLGTDWLIRMRKFAAEADGTENSLHGFCDGHAATVHINTAINRAQWPDTILHEFLHAIEKMGGFKCDEERVRYTATALRQMFRANPKLAEYLIR
jgi:hypothetical protein